MTAAPKISLCVIAGNEAAAIVRMLESFAPCFDELCLVIATGATPSDVTSKIAVEWCKARGVSAHCTHYFNRREGETYPHVDDFAAARNLSFQIATGDWLIWADCDDVFVGDAEALRNIAADTGTEAVHHFPYDVANAGKWVSRERMFHVSLLEEGARWHGAIHENFRVPSTAQHKVHGAPVWRHEPQPGKPSSGDRNLRILSAQLADAPANAFYVHQDYHLRGERAKSIKWGNVFLSFPVSDRSLRYQTHLNLSATADTHAEAARHALAAYWLYPYREALAALVNCAFQEDDATKALHFANMLINTPRPKDPLWCHEPRWYGWHGRDLLNRAERMAGPLRPLPALGYRCVLIHHTSKGDAHAVQARDAWMSTASDPHGVLHAFALPDADVNDRWFRSFVRCAESDVPRYRALASEQFARVREITSADVPVAGWDRVQNSV